MTEKDEEVNKYMMELRDQKRVIEGRDQVLTDMEGDNARMKSDAERINREFQQKIAQLNERKSDKLAGVTFCKPVQIVRNTPEPGFPPDAVNQIFMANPDKLPAFVGATNERGDFSIFRVQSVNTPGNTDKAKLDAASARLSEQVGREMLTAYLATLRCKGEVTINQANLEKK